MKFWKYYIYRFKDHASDGYRMSIKLNGQWVDLGVVKNRWGVFKRISLCSIGLTRLYVSDKIVGEANWWVNFMMQLVRKKHKKPQIKNKVPYKL